MRIAKLTAGMPQGELVYAAAKIKAAEVAGYSLIDVWCEAGFTPSQADLVGVDAKGQFNFLPETDSEG